MNLNKLLSRRLVKYMELSYFCLINPNSVNMKKLHLVLALTLVMLSASAQKIYFVYIQTESDQTFFVKMNQKTYWSSTSGYIILPRLLDSTYNLSVGFPQNKFPEQGFTVTVNKKDRGYLLKNFPDRGWGLYDLQSMEVQMASTPGSTQNDATGNNKVNAFTEILAKAADDPSLKEKTVKPKKEEVAVKTEPAVEPAKQTEAITTETASVVTPTKTEKEEVVKKPKKKNKKETEPVAENPLSEPVVTDSKPVVSNESKKNNNESKQEVKETVAVPEEKKEVKEVIPVQEEKKEIQPETKPVVKDPVAVNEEKKEIKSNTEPVKNETAVTEVKKEETKPVVHTATVPEKYQASEVKKYAESSTTEGFGLVYIDNLSNGSKDTIRLMIPNPKPVVTPVKEEPKEEKKFLEISAEAKTDAKTNTQPVQENKPVVTEEKASTEEVKTNNEEEKLSRKERKARKDEEKSVAKTEEPSVKEEKPVRKPVEKDPVVTEKAVVNSSGNFSNACVDLATEEEFVRLRKKMAGKKEGDMVDEAKKVFKTRCFSTSQVRTLGRLFETDEERYNFFDAAYKHVFNPEEFPALQSEFQDSYFSNRFKAMLR